MTTPIQEVTQFTTIVEDQGFWPKATAQSRRSALSALFGILDESQQNVEYGLESMDAIRTRFMNLNPSMRGESVDTYVSRARSTLQEFLRWKEDRAAWERNVSSRGTRSATDADKPRAERKAKPDHIAVSHGAQTSSTGRRVSFPLPSGEEFEAVIPRAGLTMEELRRIGMFLAAYTKDWQPPQSQGSSGFDALNDQSH